MPLFEINLLGTPKIIKNDKEVPLTRNKSMALLAYLADTERRVSRSDIAAIFWPNSIPSNALGALRVTLSDIKSTLGPELIMSTDDVIYLSEQSISCDVKLFREGLNTSKNTNSNSKILTEALWNGGFLKGFELHKCLQFTDWQFLEEQNILVEYRNLLNDISTELISSNNFEKALTYFRKSLILDPFDENTHRKIMELYASLGDVKAALRQYNICTDTLESEFGFPPEEQTKVLAEQIKAISKSRTGLYTISDLSIEKTKSPRIAVLPFVIRNNAKAENLNLNDIVGEVMTDLFSSTPGLEVISRTSALSYKDSTKNLPRIAAELRVDYIVEGFIEFLQDKMILESRLIHASRDAILSIEREDLEQDTKALVEAGTLIAENIVKQLGLAMKQIEQPNYEDPGKPWKLHAKHLLRDWNQADIEQAMYLYNRAIKLNPVDAEAWAGLAFAFITRGGSGTMGENMEIIFEQAEKAVIKALSIDPNQPTALWICGQISAERDWDYESAERYFIRALKYAPENSEIYNAYSQNLNTQGRPEKALTMAERACELDPVNRWNLAAKYWSLIGLQSYRKSDEVLDEINSFFPSRAHNKYGHGFTQLLLGNFKGAIKLIEPIKGELIEQQMSPFLGMLAYAYAASGRTNEALTLVEELCRDKESLIGYHMPVAATHGVLGNLDLAMDWLEMAAEARDPGFFFVATTPFYKSLYKEPRFVMLLKRVNLKAKE